MTNPMGSMGLSAGGQKAVSSPAQAVQTPRPTGPVTTQNDAKRNTYTADRSKKLREGNLASSS